MSELLITTLAERPHLADPMWRLTEAWPEFMTKDPTGALFYNRASELFANQSLVATETQRPDQPVARGFLIPFALRGEELPDGGWDTVINWGIQDYIDGRRPTHVSALEITISPPAQGRGYSYQMIRAMRNLAATFGVATLVAPVRPIGKSDQPLSTMTEYAFSVRSDGLPIDRWLRAHVRAGARIVKVAERAMVIVASLDDWRDWTGEPFNTDGPHLVEGGLVPVSVDTVRQLGTYVEPNVWVEHRLE